MGDSGRSILVPKRRPNARRRLFCFPHAGVGPSVFRGWADDLPVDTEICLIQLPGRESRLRETPYSSIASLMPMLMEAMSPLVDKPFALYGHSLGALVAFECALHLRRLHHVEPVQFFVGATPAPQLPWRHSPVRSLPEEDFLSAMEERYGALPREVLADAEMRALVLPILRADVIAFETYKYSPEPPFNCDMTVFGGIHDHVVTRTELESWRDHISGRFRLQMLDGNHLFLKSCRTQLLESIAGELNSYSDRPQPASAFDETRT
jgi:medium-chain acyl-[acyl-carrier-protein] hydrolase